MQFPDSPCPFCPSDMNMGSVTRPYNVLSHCHTKRRYDTDLSKKFWLKIHLKSQCHTKRRKGVAMRAHFSFGMTTTQNIKDLFA